MHPGDNVDLWLARKRNQHNSVLKNSVPGWQLRSRCQSWVGVTSVARLPRSTSGSGRSPPTQPLGLLFTRCPFSGQLTTLWQPAITAGAAGSALSLTSVRLLSHMARHRKVICAFISSCKARDCGRDDSQAVLPAYVCGSRTQQPRQCDP